MLDHVFMDTIGALRRAFEGALLERQAADERFLVDVLLGDTSWETTYTLPGEGVPPRVRCDVALDWPTWSQSAYRSLVLGEDADDPPEVGIEVVLRVQRLAAGPDLAAVLAVVPEEGPSLGDDRLDRVGPTVEESFGRELEEHQYAVEVTYEGSYRLDEPRGADLAARLDEHFGPLGRWAASVLVRLGDLRFDFLPPDTEAHGRP